MPDKPKENECFEIGDRVMVAIENPFEEYLAEVIDVDVDGNPILLILDSDLWEGRKIKKGDQLNIKKLGSSPFN